MKHYFDSTGLYICCPELIVITSGPLLGPDKLDGTVSPWTLHPSRERVICWNKFFKILVSDHHRLYVTSIAPTSTTAQQRTIDLPNKGCMFTWVLLTFQTRVCTLPLNINAYKYIRAHTQHLKYICTYVKWVYYINALVSTILNILAVFTYYDTYHTDIYDTYTEI